MTTATCTYCPEPAEARKVIRGGYTIPVCEDCLAEDRREHDDPDEPAEADDDNAPEAA